MSGQCDSCFKRPGDVVQDEVVQTIEGPWRHVFRLCRWCRAVWTRRGWPMPVMPEVDDA